MSKRGDWKQWNKGKANGIAYDFRSKGERRVDLLIKRLEEQRLRPRGKVK